MKRLMLLYSLFFFLFTTQSVAQLKKIEKNDNQNHKKVYIHQEKHKNQPKKTDSLLNENSAATCSCNKHKKTHSSNHGKGKKMGHCAEKKLGKQYNQDQTSKSCCQSKSHKKKIKKKDNHHSKQHQKRKKHKPITEKQQITID